MIPYFVAKRIEANPSIYLHTLGVYGLMSAVIFYVCCLWRRKVERLLEAGAPLKTSH